MKHKLVVTFEADDLMGLREAVEAFRDDVAAGGGPLPAKLSHQMTLSTGGWNYACQYSDLGQEET